MIAATMDQTRNNVSEAARVLGLTRRGLYLKMTRLGHRPRRGYQVTRYPPQWILTIHVRCAKSAARFSHYN